MDEKELKTLLDGIAKENGKTIREAVKTEVEAATAGVMKSSELASKLEAMQLKDDTIKKLMDAVEKQGEELRKIFNAKPTPEKSFSEVIHDKAKEIQAIAKGGGNVKLTVDKTLVTRALVSGSTMAMRLPDVGQLPYLGTVLAGLFRHVTVSPSSNGVIRYYDQAAVTRGAASVAEGATKPESAISWIERTASN